MNSVLTLNLTLWLSVEGFLVLAQWSPSVLVTVCTAEVGLGALPLQVRKPARGVKPYIGVQGCSLVSRHSQYQQCAESESLAVLPSTPSCPIHALPILGINGISSCPPPAPASFSLGNGQPCSTGMGNARLPALAQF